MAGKRTTIMNQRNKGRLSIALLTALIGSSLVSGPSALAQSAEQPARPGLDADSGDWLNYFLSRTSNIGDRRLRGQNSDFETLSFSGDCELSNPCVVEHQEDGSWIASCQPGWDGSSPRFTGTYTPAGSLNVKSEQGDVECSNLRRTRDGWSGTCEKTVQPDPESEATTLERCSVNIDTKDKTVAYSAKLPSELTDLTFCGTQFGDCKVAQDDVDLTLMCGEGDDTVMLRATMVGNTFQHWSRRGEDWYDCTGHWDGQGLTGACTKWVGFGSDEPADACEDLAFTAQDPLAHGTCEQILPQEGFTLQGCGMEDACVAVQRGCDWQINCGDKTYSGRINRRRRMHFENSAGQKCIASVGRDGKVRGSCRNSLISWHENVGQGMQACAFRSVAAQPSQACFQMPSTISTRGCGAFFDNCRVYQDGCEFMTQCESGQHNFYGVVDSDGIEFTGLAGYTCTADLVDEDGKQRLLGGCTRQEQDGTISECRDLSEAFGARLALDWDQ